MKEVQKEILRRSQRALAAAREPAAEATLIAAALLNALLAHCVVHGISKGTIHEEIDLRLPTAEKEHAAVRGEISLKSVLH